MDVSEKIRFLEKNISDERYTVAKLKGKIKQIESEFWEVVVLWIILIILTIDFFTNFLDFIIIFKIISGNLYLKVAYIIGYVYLLDIHSSENRKECSRIYQLSECEKG